MELHQTRLPPCSLHPRVYRLTRDGLPTRFGYHSGIMVDLNRVTDDRDTKKKNTVSDGLEGEADAQERGLTTEVTMSCT